MHLEEDHQVHEDIIIPDGSPDNQDDARLNENFELSKEIEKKRKAEKAQFIEKKPKVKKIEQEVAEEVLH
jgi:hypothetical protein